MQVPCIPRSLTQRAKLYGNARTWDSKTSFAPRYRNNFRELTTLSGFRSFFPARAASVINVQQKTWTLFCVITFSFNPFITTRAGSLTAHFHRLKCFFARLQKDPHCPRQHCFELVSEMGARPSLVPRILNAWKLAQMTKRRRCTIEEKLLRRGKQVDVVIRTKYKELKNAKWLSCF